MGENTTMMDYNLELKRNRIGVAQNSYQNVHPKVLFVCSAGILRSATASHVFSAEPYNWNTRSAGSVLEYALNPVTEALLLWADEIYLMEPIHLQYLETIFPEDILSSYRPKIKVLNVPDDFTYREPELIKILIEQVTKMTTLEKIG